jgi:hypothetical protein
MAIPRKPAPASVQSSAASADLLQIFMFRKVLSREQAERVRKYARANSIGIIPTIVEVKLATEVQIGESLATFAGLRFVKINPLELELDVVTGALSAAFARRHGLVAIAKTATALTVAVHDPLAPFPSTTSRTWAASTSSAWSPGGRKSMRSRRTSTTFARA